MFSRNSQPAYVDALREGFKVWMFKRFGGKVEASTPCKAKREVALAVDGRKRKLTNDFR